MNHLCSIMENSSMEWSQTVEMGLPGSRPLPGTKEFERRGPRWPAPCQVSSAM